MHSIIQHLLAAYDFITLCTLEPFLPLLDRLKGDSQVEVNKAILKNFSRLTTTINDQLIINIMFSVGKVVHDSITSLSSAEQRAEVTDLCIAFIRGVEYGRDVEKHLNFFVECRFVLFCFFFKKNSDNVFAGVLSQIWTELKGFSFWVFFD